MLESIYSYRNYKSYLLDKIENEPRAGRGLRKKMADAMKCQIAYVSLVLGGDRHLNIDQAEALTRFLGLGKDEQQYFIWLVEWERSGTRESRRFFEDLLESKRRQYLQLKKRVAIQNELDDTAKAIYYSETLYSEVHMLTTIPAFQTVQAIAARLKEPAERVSSVLRFLKMHGLVDEQEGKFSPTNKYLYVDAASPFVTQHHNNWRLKAMQSLSQRRDDNLHLSMAVTLSLEDAKTLRKKIARFIEEASQLIKDSKEEELYGFNVDFFKT